MDAYEVDNGMTCTILELLNVLIVVMILGTLVMGMLLGIVHFACGCFCKCGRNKDLKKVGVVRHAISYRPPKRKTKMRQVLLLYLLISGNALDMRKVPQIEGAEDDFSIMQTMRNLAEWTHTLTLDDLYEAVEAEFGINSMRSLVVWVHGRFAHHGPRGMRRSCWLNKGQKNLDHILEQVDIYDDVEIRGVVAKPSPFDAVSGNKRRPHIILVNTRNDDRSPYLVDYQEEETSRRVTLLLEAHRGTIQTREIFEKLSRPGICEECECYVEVGRRYDWPEEVYVGDQTYFEALLRCRQPSEQETTTTAECSEEEPEEDSWEGKDETEDEELGFMEINQRQTNAQVKEECGERWNTDNLKVPTKERAAGQFSDREGNTELNRRLDRTRKMEAMQWEVQRLEAERHTAVAGQTEITEEMTGLAEHRADRKVLLFLFGIRHFHIRTERLWVDTRELFDFVDVATIIRRKWEDQRDREGNLVMDLIYINPQPTPAMMLEDGVAIICDFAPESRDIPIAVVTRGIHQDTSQDYDRTVHRTPVETSCSHLQFITGVIMLCEYNARCVCWGNFRTFRGPQMSLASRGLRYDIEMDFREQGHAGQDEGQRNLREDEESATLMQIGQPEGIERRYPGHMDI